MMILRNFLLLRFSVEKMARRHPGPNRRNIDKRRSKRVGGYCSGWKIMFQINSIQSRCKLLLTDPKGLTTKPRQDPLDTKQAAHMKRASRYRADRRPSRQPPPPMDLATPFFRHLARPREAEKTERERVRMNSIRPSVNVPAPKTDDASFLSPSAPERLSLN